MKLPRIHTAGLTRIAAILALGISAVYADPTITIPLGGKEFGSKVVNGITKSANFSVNSGDKKLSPSTKYIYEVTGTCKGTGFLARAIPAGTPFSSVLKNISGNKAPLSGVYSSKNGQFPIVFIQKSYPATLYTKPIIGSFYFGANLKGGVLENGQVYYKVTNAKLTSSPAQPVATIKFEAGSKLIIRTAPQILVNQTNYALPGSTGSVDVKIVRYGYNKNVVSAHYETVDGDAIAGTDYTAQSGTVTFNAGESQKIITIPIQRNTHGPCQFSLKLSNPSAQAVLVAPKTVSTIRIYGN